MKSFDQLFMEATQSVEEELKLENKDWIVLGSGSNVITNAARIANVQTSRLYYAKDPLGKQAIRLWTDYTFGGGMTWQTKDTKVSDVLHAFWDAPINRPILSAQGQRKSSDKVLVEGEVFFAIFLGEETTIRLINPLEITEIISNPDDKEDVRFYRREWTNAQGEAKSYIYRSVMNPKGEPTVDAEGKEVSQTEGALVYHLAGNTIEQRGNPLLLPALDWIKQYRKFIASRVAVMLALARFAWHAKTKGGQTSIDTVKAALNDKTPDAGSALIENAGVDTQPIKTDTGASNAYQDGKMLKLQVCAACGIPEQYFGDVSAGSLATAQTVELPMMKMFQSYQKIWGDTYQNINNIVLEHAGIPPDKWAVDIDFPPITPTDAIAVADAIGKVAMVMPSLADSRDVQQMALLALGINNTEEVLKAMNESNPNVSLIKALRGFKESIKEGA